MPRAPQKPKAAEPREARSDRRLYLAEHRRDAGLSQEEVGEAMGGKNKSYISRLERGGIQVTEQLLFLYADAIGRPAERLFRLPGELTIDDMVSAIPDEFQRTIRELVATHYKNRPQ